MRIVKFASDTQVSQASAATDLLIGVYVGPADAVTTSTGNVVCLLGECRLEVAGAVTRGQLLTSDGDGKGIPAAPSAGVNSRIVAMALMSGTDTTIRVLVIPSMMQGA